MAHGIESIDFNGLPALRLQAGGASAIVSLFGGQVLSWTPRGGKEWLYLSETAKFDRSTPIRGGVPVCFPQFADLGKLPKHGFVRTVDWMLADRRVDKDFALIQLRLEDSAETRALWNHPFGIELTISIEDNRLDLEFEVDNRGTDVLSFTGALHTYLRVREAEEARLEGLYGFTYRDSANGNAIKRETGDALMVDAEVDRVYRQVNRPLLLRDGSRTLGINTEGFPDVVVWNPWETRCAALADMPDNGFRRMLCVEAAAADTPITVAAGEQWWGRQTLIAL
ncbi:D-hexose-6-phosphate mutarotase [Parazoarcus communis]|uniref:Putative glucose-6-phosphate 1-epimerase n=1 Tax=Parazoarcus communis SWub3 = DSM 12120 TaxID=1121029 RepID=A0A323UUJ9_9RHOO|nr:D-hexose-6-phosphate mutarotase [Parazoarcus communis]NMG70312.1 D-hexose-6-phosphate mutarotase [Parazoarcus communis SWub3 = DSM 12120]PZA16087.1 D-hexose-6-phosphate mutarotase [Azoarcus communis] [Parazoarcus communis SWub3 = DSM 12120]